MAQIPDSFSQGIAAFKAGQYKQALKYFQKTQQGGSTSAKLQYNLAVTYFKLGEFESAKEHFINLTQIKKWRALAHYNIGLIFLKQNNTNQATNEFKKALANATSDKLKTLISRKLKQKQSLKPWKNIASFAAGHDDNALLTPDSLTIKNEKVQSRFIEGWISSERALIQKRKQNITLSTGAYVQSYTDLEDYDYYSLWLGGKHKAAWNKSNLTTELKLIPAFSDEGHLSTTSAVNIQLQRRFFGCRLKAKGNISYIAGSNQQDYLSGWKYQLTTEFFRKQGAIKYGGGYRYEKNNRKDLLSENSFFSYSPERHKIFASASMNLPNSIQLSSTAMLENSRYQNENQQLTLDGAVIKKRKETKTGLSLKVEYSGLQDYLLFAEYRYTNNSSNFDQYEYSRNQLLAGVIILF